MLYADLTPTRGASASTFGVLAYAVVAAGDTRAADAHGGLLHGVTLWRLLLLGRLLPELLQPGNARLTQKPAAWAAAVAFLAVAAQLGPIEQPLVADCASFWSLWGCFVRFLPPHLKLRSQTASMAAAAGHAESDLESHLGGAAVAAVLAWCLRPDPMPFFALRSLVLPLSLLVANNVSPRWWRSNKAASSSSSSSSLASDEEGMVWFGTKPARLVAAPSGTIEVYTKGKYAEDFSDSALSITLSRSKPLEPPPPPEGNDGAAAASSGGLPPVVVPAVPSVELRLCRKEDESSNDAQPPQSPPPAALCAPLIKVSLDDAQQVEGGSSTDSLDAIASGVRSALVSLDGGVWYRLKGCGNGNGGFVIRTTHAKAGAWRDVRGSAFVHTARRELYMAEKLGSALEAMGCVSANLPCCLWRYDAPTSPLGQDELFQAACAVERTRGDRRLGTHVLSGIDLLLPMLVGGDNPVDEQQQQPLLLLAQLFPSSRPDGAQISTAELMTDAMMAFELNAAAAGGGAGSETTPQQEESSHHGLTWPNVPRTHDLFACALEGRDAFCEHAPLPDAPPPSQWTQHGAQPMAEQWIGTWRRACDEYRSVLRELEAAGRYKASVLAYLMARIGSECGSILRTMHLAGYSWGTYVDAMCFDGQWHCNAHSNNVVVLSEREAAQTQAAFLSGQQGGGDGPPLCAALDFDMAFTKGSYVDMQNATIGATDGDFATLLARERLNFGEVLAGGDSTSGVPQVALGVVEAQPAMVRTVRHALHDTLVHAFLRAYDDDDDDASATGGSHVAAFDPLLHRGAYAVLRMAIAMMADCVA